MYLTLLVVVLVCGLGGRTPCVACFGRETNDNVFQLWGEARVLLSARVIAGMIASHSVPPCFLPHLPGFLVYRRGGGVRGIHGSLFYASTGSSPRPPHTHTQVLNRKKPAMLLVLLVFLFAVPDKAGSCAACFGGSSSRWRGSTASELRKGTKPQYTAVHTVAERPI